MYVSYVLKSLVGSLRLEGKPISCAQTLAMCFYLRCSICMNEMYDTNKPQIGLQNVLLAQIIYSACGAARHGSAAILRTESASRTICRLQAAIVWHVTRDLGTDRRQP